LHLLSHAIFIIETRYTSIARDIPLDTARENPDTTIEDKEILKITLELIQQLNISNSRPAKVSWRDSFEQPWEFDGVQAPDSETMMLPPRVREVPVGWCVFTWDEVILPLEMKGKFDPREWRPLLATCLIYEKKLSMKRNLGILAIAGLPTLLVALGWIELFRVSSPARGIPALLLIVDIAGSISLLALVGSPVNWFARRLRLQADILAANHVGRETFLAVLEKMKNLGLKDTWASDKTRFFGPGFPFTDLIYGRPTSTARVKNLSGRIE